jgi:hypothetical protein
LARGDLTRPTDATIKRLFARSGNRCAFPKCTVEIVQGDTLVGEMCHIKAAHPGGPRYDPNQTAAERHGYDNLILMCGTHHTVIDADEEAYTVERLIRMKIDHERAVTPVPDDRTASGTQLLIDQSISVANQSGGITAHTINIYAGQPSATSAQSSVPQPASFPRAQPKDGPARFRVPGEALGVREPAGFLDTGGSSIFLAPGPAMWLRLMPPFDPGKKWTSAALGKALDRGINLPTFIGPADGTYSLRAEDGVGTCILSRNEVQTKTAAFVSKTGEVRAIDTWVLGTEQTMLLSVEIEKMLTEQLPRYGYFLSLLGLEPPYRWIAGCDGVKNRQLQYPRERYAIRIPGMPGRLCASEQVITEGVYAGKQLPMSTLLPFFEDIYDACGIERPEHLPHFWYYLKDIMLY